MGAPAPPAGVVLDASAAIALLRDEPTAPEVERVLRELPARMSVVNAAETVDVLVRRYRKAAHDVVDGVEGLLSTVEAVPASLELAVRAGELRAKLFDHRSRRLSLADCFVLATADSGESIVTTDDTLAAAARAEGIDVVNLHH